MRTVLLACASFLLLARPVAAEDPLDARLRQATAFAQQQLDRTASAVSATAYPQKTSSTGAWFTTGASAWTSGFLPGTFWLAHQLTGGSAMRTRAQTWQAGIEPQKTNTSTHDVGFMLYDSFGNGHRLTGSSTYRQVALTAASSLAARYDPVVGAVRSWNTANDFRVIVDNMMNLELLVWGARNGGQAAWKDMAISHALKTRAHHVRADGSTYHVVDFSETTGALVRKTTHQGAFTESSWARGSAWAMHGFTMMYRETGDVRFLETARLTSDFFLANLPADGVPYWDFEAPNIPNEPRDSSAAAIAAAGLIELSRLETDATRRERYRDQADRLLTALTGTGYLAQGTLNAAVLLHGTYNKPAGDFNTGLSWGDYYLLQALARRQLLPPPQAALPIAGARASADDGNPAAGAVDGNPATRWSATGDGQWLELDLGAAKAVGKVTVAFHRGDQLASRFDVQTSADAVTWTTRRSALSSGTTLQAEAFDIPDVMARYVRILGHGTAVDALNGVTEVTVRAGEVADTTPPPVPTASPVPGTYSAPVSVSLTSEAGAVIRYTTDGSAPTGTSPIYSGPISVSSSRTIRAFADDAAGNRSATASLSYVIQQPYSVMYSASSSRSNPVNLAGRTVSGLAYLFTSPDTGVAKVDFYLDGVLRRTESAAPFDFNGATSSGATAFDTRTLSDGAHTVRAVLHRTTGGTVTVDAPFTVANAAATTFSLRYSTSPSRTSPVALAGASVTGSIYVFVLPEAGASRVDFYLDGALRKTELNAPWDFAGATSTGAVAWNTGTVAPGQHTIRAVVTRSAGGTEDVRATFTVR